jgi:hypothetical protein
MTGANANGYRGYLTMWSRAPHEINEVVRDLYWDGPWNELPYPFQILSETTMEDHNEQCRRIGRSSGPTSMASISTASRRIRTEFVEFAYFAYLKRGYSARR